MKRPVPASDAGRTILCREWIELLDELNIGAFAVDGAGKIFDINYAAQALIGLKEKDVLGCDCREVFVGVPCMVKCLLRGSPDYDRAARHREPAVTVDDEDERTHLLTRMATPIYDAENKIAGCLTILQDHSPIADLIDRIHYEERSMKLILDSLDVAIFTVNRSGYITFFNKAAERISGYGRMEVLGEPYTVIFKEGATGDSERLMEAIIDGRMPTTRQVRMTAKNGDVIPIRTNYMPLKNERDIIVGGLATLHDLTLVRQLNQVIRDRYTFHDMIGKDPAMEKIFEKVSVVADTDATVLIEGNTGTGKDLLAKVIHNASRRKGAPFVKVNCAAIPENLLESELFGYAKGAFTGALRDKPGRFSEADRGTIFLDEIGDLPLALQAKLLRVLEDREFYPLGSRHTQKVDVCIISATNRGLEKLVADGLFRQDLYYRLNIFRILLPDLKDRQSDIPLLIHHILRKLCAARDDRRVEIAGDAMELLLNFEYPGNVRELENILEHALVVCPEDEIHARHLPEYVQEKGADAGAAQAPATRSEPRIGVAECDRIRELLHRYGGHREKTAEALGVSRITLWRRMKKCGIEG